ncbi:hydrogen peroxide-inducible genes activator [Exilibacterium tricleocarpae]|uniref:Hydrogen peroxide-inducible genes activator n=1 Tax=Exilibacterium tricleocarpae TaxID=2591008 RepID=A0A545TN89_9GAMM|nr:hydrogen peroxide-inducible genes activator [Exilibacterium tricleocarpae]TQV78697.1 hydrogen peroxide-inducible genes activator [Exilibacterium tricleocarpae]
MSYLPSLKQLKYLCAVAEHRHFGHAAKACHVSQSTLSAGIQELESQLSAGLIERNNKQVMMTPLGEDICSQAQRILLAVDDLMASCEVRSAPLSGSLRLGVIPTIAPYILPKLLNRLRRSYPRLRVFIREEMSRPLTDALQNGELDVLLLALPFPANGVEVMPLFDDPFVLAAPRGHPLTAASSVPIEALRGSELLLLEDGHCLRDHALDACKLNPRDLRVPYQATSLTTIVQMVANGIGITLLPQMAVDAKILHGTRIQTRPFAEQEITRHIGLMWRGTSPRQAEYRMLGDFIKAGD